MISPDLAETVKRLRELLPKITPEWGLDPTDDMRVRAPNGWIVANVVYAHRGDSDDKAMSVANAAYIAAANRKTISSILDAFEGLERAAARIDMLHAAIAHGDDDHRKWLADAIKAHFAGEPVPPVYGRGKLEARCEAAEAKVTSLESSLAEARKGARTKGTVEVCPKCKLGTDALGSSWCQCEEGNCPVHEANGWT